MADITLRVVGPGASDLDALRRAAATAIPAAFLEDSNFTATVLSVQPGGVVPVRYETSDGGLPFTGSDDGSGGLATASTADVTVSLAISMASSVHLTSPINVDYGFARLLEDRLEGELRKESVATDIDVRVLPIINSTFLRPAAPVLLRLPRQALVAVTLTLALLGDPAPAPGAGTRLLPFDGPRQTALIEVVDTLLTNRTGLVQLGLDSVVARAGRGGGGGGARTTTTTTTPRRALRAAATNLTYTPSPPYDEVNATVFLISAATVASVRAALQTVLSAPDRSSVRAAGDRSLLVQGLALEGLAISSVAMLAGDDGLDEAITRAPRFQLAPLASQDERARAKIAARRRMVVAVTSTLASAVGAFLLATMVILAIRARRRAVAGPTTGPLAWWRWSGSKASTGTGTDGGAGGGKVDLASGPSSLGAKSVQGGIFAAMLGAGGSTMTVPPPTLRRAQPGDDEEEEGGDGGGGGSSSKPTKPPPHIAGDAEWEVDPADLTISTRPDGTDWLLGTGGAGAVFRGTRGGVGDVAIKLLLRGTPRDREALAAEARLLRRISRDAGVVQFYGACLTGPCPLLILEYMAGGDLYAAIGESASAVRKQGRGRASGGGAAAAAAPLAAPTPSSLPSVQWWSAGRRLALDVARGLHFLHASRVRHGDLKSSNILLTAGRTAAKIGDVGLAKVLGSHTTAAAGGGTFAYAAPEVLMNARCDERSDMWSFGVLVWELCTLTRPDRGGMRPVTVPGEAPACIASLIGACMADSPDARLTAKEAYDAIAASPESAEEEEDCWGTGG